MKEKRISDSTSRISIKGEGRCLIPISGYYEWHDSADGKQLYYFTRRDGAPITIASLWASGKTARRVRRSGHVQ